MASIENKPNFKPDLGPEITHQDDPGQSTYARVESVFIRMIKAALYKHDRWTWRENEEKRDIEILSSASNEAYARLPQIRVQVGPLQEFDGSIDNLKEWTNPLERHLYVDQAQAVIVCTCELNEEAAALADHLRRLIDLADRDFGKYGIFGIQSPDMQPPKSARKGTEDDDVYEAVLQTPFAVLERQQREDAESDPILRSIQASTEYTADDSGVESGIYIPEQENVDEASSASIEHVKGYANDNQVIVRFDKKIKTYQVSGILVKIKQEIPGTSILGEGSEILVQYDDDLGKNEYNAPVVRDSDDFHQLVIEIPEKMDENFDVLVSYDKDDGNLRDYDGKIVQDFGPIRVEWSSKI